MNKAIEIEGLRKAFKGHLSIGEIQAVSGVDLEVPENVIYGFIGPNGAGKTTTLKILTGLLKPDAGTAKVLGRDVADRSVHMKMGFLPETPYFYDYLTGEELLTFFGRLFGLSASVLRERVDALLRQVGLEGKGKLQLRKYSKGMLQRVGLAQALLNDPELVILDEPMSGLDPIGRREVRDLILELKQAGKTVFFSSHILADAEMICDEVGIIVGGKLVKHGPLHALLGREVRFWDITVKGWADLPDHQKGRCMARQEDRVLLRVESEEAVQEILDGAREVHAAVLGVVPHKASLEDLFLEQIPGGSAT